MIGRSVIKQLGSNPRSRLRSLYQSRTLAEVADVLDVDASTVLHAMRHLRIARRSRHTGAPKGVVAKTLTRRGKTTRRSARQMFELMYRTQRKGLLSIANDLGVGVGSVHNFAVNNGISLRRVGRPRK